VAKCSSGFLSSQAQAVEVPHEEKIFKLRRDDRPSRRYKCCDHMVALFSIASPFANVRRTIVQYASEGTLERVVEDRSYDKQLRELALQRLANINQNAIVPVANWDCKLSAHQVFDQIEADRILASDALMMLSNRDVIARVAIDNDACPRVRRSALYRLNKNLPESQVVLATLIVSNSYPSGSLNDPVSPEGELYLTAGGLLDADALLEAVSGSNSPNRRGCYLRLGKSSLP
jgi:hypothetical protein